MGLFVRCLSVVDRMSWLAGGQARDDD